MNFRFAHTLPSIHAIKERLANISLASLSPLTLFSDPADQPERSSTRRRIIKAIFYPLLFLFAFITFFLPDYLNTHLEEFLPKLLQQQQAVTIQFTAPEISGYLPPKFIAQRCVISPKQAAIPPITLHNITLSPALSGLFAGRFGVSYLAKGFGGKITGTLGTGTFSLSSLRLNIEGSDIDTAQIPKIKEFDNAISGVANFDLTVTAAPDAINQAEGTLQADLKQVVMTNIVPIFTVPKLTITNANLDLDFTGPRITLNKFTVNSDVIHGSLDGTMLVTPQNIGKTQLELRGHLLPNPKTTVLDILDAKAVKLIKEHKSVSVSITKTIEMPVIKLR